MNTIQYKVLEPQQQTQIDLKAPMRMEKVVQNGKELQVQHDGNAYFVQFTEPQQPGSVNKVQVYYGDKPQVSVNPPWSGGISCRYDASGKPFVANSNQGDGASCGGPAKTI